jgi:hypothetical protein
MKSDVAARGANRAQFRTDHPTVRTNTNAGRQLGKVAKQKCRGL